MKPVGKPSLWQQTIDTIETVDLHRRHPDLQEAVLRAAFLLEKASIAPQLEARLGLSNSQGWTKDVIAEPVDLAARDRLVASLQQLATERLDDPAVGSIYWALGKAGDKTLIPFFQKALLQQLQGVPGAVFQILIALERLGERPFTGRESHSINNEGENVKFARRYLASVGVDTVGKG